MIIEHNKGTAFELVIPMVDKDAPESFKTGVSPTDTAYYKDGAGAWTALAITDTLTEIASTGMYAISLTAAELNHDWVVIKGTEASSADTFITFRLGSGPLVSIKAKTDLLGTGVVSFTGPVLPSGDVSIIAGDDYKKADGRGFRFTDTSWPDLTSATGIKLSFQLAGDEGAEVTTITGTNDGVDAIEFDMVKAESIVFSSGDDIYWFDAQAILASGSEVTLIHPGASRMTVTEQVTE